MDKINVKDYRILLIDDKQEFLDGMILDFGRKFDFVTTTTAEEAFNILEKEKIAVVISDQEMPDMKGLEILTEIKEKYPEIVNVLVTGFTKIDVAIEAINESIIYRYISKTDERDAVIALISQAIEKYVNDKELKKLRKRLKFQEKYFAICDVCEVLGRRLSGLFLGIKKHIPQIDTYEGSITEQITASRSSWIETMFAAIISYLTKMSVPINSDSFVDFNFKETLVIDKINNVPGVELFCASGSEADDMLRKANLFSMGNNIVDVLFDIEEDLPNIKGEPDKIFDYIVDPIIKNSCTAIRKKFMSVSEMNIEDKSEGIIVIKVKTVVKDEERCVELSISDNGCGVPPMQKMEQLTLPFISRWDSLGLGLSKASYAASMHDASMEISNNEGEGASVKIWFPVA